MHHPLDLIALVIGLALGVLLIFAFLVACEWTRPRHGRGLD